MPKQTSPTKVKESRKSSGGVEKTQKEKPNKHLPPITLVKRVVRKSVPGKAFRSSDYKILQQAAYLYARSLVEQAKNILAIQGGKTFGFKHLQLMANISACAGSIVDQSSMQQIVDEVKAHEESPEFLKKKEEAKQKKKNSQTKKTLEQIDEIMTN